MSTPAVLIPILEVSGSPPQRVTQQRAAARAALAHCARRCSAPTDGWRQSADGAPVPNAGFFWSLSHKRHWAAAAIARSPVGIDVEQLAPRSPELFEKIATPAEWALLGARDWDNFFRLWTAKEATLKANSVGIGYLADCTLTSVETATTMSVRFGTAVWSVQQFTWDGHIAAVAGREPVEWDVLSME